MATQGNPQKHPKPLPPDEQMDLCCKAKAGDRHARNRLIATSMRFVVSRATYFARRTPGADLDDFVNDGVLGLMQAITKFDPERGAQFLTCAGKWIDSYIRTGGVAFVRDIKPSTMSRSAFVRYYRDARADGATHDEAIAHVVKQRRVKRETANAVVAALTRTSHLSLQTHLTGGAEATFQDMIPDETESVEARLDRARTIEYVQRKLAPIRAVMSAREQAILDGRFLADAKPATLCELGDRYGISKERIRQIELKLTAKVRAVLDPHAAAG